VSGLVALIIILLLFGVYNMGKTELFFHNRRRLSELVGADVILDPHALINKEIAGLYPIQC